MKKSSNDINNNNENNLNESSNNEDNWLPPFGRRQFLNREEIIKMLQERVDEYKCSVRAGPGGMALKYMETFKLIEIADAVFGFDGWSTRIINLNVDFVDEDKGKYKVGVTVVIRIELKDGTYHEDVGIAGACNSDKCKALEVAKKAAVSSGVKRALRYFGNFLGNCLYDKFFTCSLDMDHCNKKIKNDIVTYESVRQNIDKKSVNKEENNELNNNNNEEIYKNVRLIKVPEYDPEMSYSLSDLETEEPKVGEDNSNNKQVKQINKDNKQKEDIINTNKIEQKNNDNKKVVNSKQPVKPIVNSKPQVKPIVNSKQPVKPIVNNKSIVKPTVNNKQIVNTKIVNNNKVNTNVSSKKLNKQEDITNNTKTDTQDIDDILDEI